LCSSILVAAAFSQRIAAWLHCLIDNCGGNCVPDELLVCIRENDYLLCMAFLFLFFTVALSLCVAGLIIIALAAILGTVRDDWKLKKTEKNERELPPRDR
jgi:hypothetical protein